MPLPTPAMALATRSWSSPLRERPTDAAPHGGCSTALPAAVRPIRLPRIWCPVGEPALTIPTPVWHPEIRLRAAAVRPPITAPVCPVISICLFGFWSTRAVPAASVPRKQPSTLLVSKAPLVKETPTSQLLMTSPLMMTSLAEIVKQARSPRRRSRPLSGPCSGPDRDSACSRARRSACIRRPWRRR